MQPVRTCRNTIVRSRIKLLCGIYLAPDKHAAEDNLKPVEEVITYNDDCCTAGRPAFIRTNRFDRRRRSAQKTCAVSQITVITCSVLCSPLCI